MQLYLTKIASRVNLNTAIHESRRRGMSLIVCRFNNSYAYILVHPMQASRLAGNFPVVVESSVKIPLVKQHMQLQTTGQYQTHRTERRNYRATTVENTVRMASLYISTM